MDASELKGKVVVLTGKFTALKRNEAEAALAALGATIGGGISKKTDVLFVGEKAGSKLAKAQALGVSTYDEAVLVALLAGVDAKAEGAKADAERAAASAPRRETPVSAFSGKNIALTGTFATMKRSDAQRVLAEAGASVSSSVSKKTDLLIHGVDAGSKLDKAMALGVVTMTEEEMVSALSAAGAGAAELAGAEAKLADKKKAEALTTTEMTAVVAELRAFVAALKKRSDVVVEIASLGRKASKSEVAQARKIHPELADFYAEMNGIHVEWRFKEPSGYGTIRIPGFSQWTKFTRDDEHYMNFGEAFEALLLDEITPEGTTWLVRDRKSKATRIVFASAAEGADGVEPAQTIAAYIRRAIDNGFCHYWPRCGVTHPYVSYAEFEEALARFKAPPAKPSPIKDGTRVTFQYFAEGGRGVVVETKSVPPSPRIDFYGNELARVELDVGSEAWIPFKFMKASPKKADAYERLRARGGLTGDDPLATLEAVARAIGPLGHHSITPVIGSMPSNARRAAGILSTRAFADAVTEVLDLYDAASAAGLDFHEDRELSKNGDEFSKTDFARFRWKWRISDSFVGLIGGLAILAANASAERSVAYRELLPKSMVKRLASVGIATSLAERLATDETSAQVAWMAVGPSAEELALLQLPEDAVVLAGGGF